MHSSPETDSDRVYTHSVTDSQLSDTLPPGTHASVRPSVSQSDSLGLWTDANQPAGSQQYLAIDAMGRADLFSAELIVRSRQTDQP